MKPSAVSLISKNFLLLMKILFVNHDITPYVADTELSLLGRLAPKTVQEGGNEIRTFMPRWGNINERRGQLHEVIRLSGLNITINDMDHPLIIKVATIPQTKVQVYFIDNQEFFERRAQTVDEAGQPFADNGERAVFFARGVIETIKKLRWTPDIIHCQGWMSAFVPLYVRQAYATEPTVMNAKIVTTFFNDFPQQPLEDNLKACLLYNKKITKKSLSAYNDVIDGFELARIAIDNSDGVIAATPDVRQDIIDYAQETGKHFLQQPEGSDFAAEYAAFYNQL